MGRPFGDITLYAETPHLVGTKEYLEDTSLQNYICDLYGVCMHGYKPPYVTRICIQTAYFNIWDRTWKTGSLISAAAYFQYDEYSILNTFEKFKYILELVHNTILALCLEYKWNKNVFEKAYEEVLTNNFEYKIKFESKLSKDRKKTANIILTKTIYTTSVSIYLESEGKKSVIKLFEKKNWFWYDSANKLSRNNKWFDNDKFGLFYKPLAWCCWYSIKGNSVTFENSGNLSNESNIQKLFIF